MYTLLVYIANPFLKGNIFVFEARESHDLVFPSSSFLLRNLDPWIRPWAIHWYKIKSLYHNAAFCILHYHV